MKKQFIKTNQYGKFYFSNEEMTILHREDGPAADFFDGSKEYWLNGERHRKDGPAGEYSNGIRTWYKNGKRHREDGPAMECDDGYKSWWIEGKQYTEEEFNEIKFLTLSSCFNNFNITIKI